MIRYAVPTRGRAATVTERTLIALASAGVNPADIDLWVDDDQEHDYARQVPLNAYGALMVVPRDRAMGLGPKRNYLVRQYEPGTRLVQCDDDIKAFYQARTRQRPLLPLLDLPYVAEWAFNTADKIGLGLWGPYPLDNPYFMRPLATSDLRVITGPCFGHTVVGDDTELLVLDEKEDFERCVRYALRDGGVLRLNWIGYRTDYYSDQPGGYTDYRNAESIESQAQRLAGMFPDHVQYLGVKRTHGYAEVRLRRGKPVHPPIPAPLHD